MIVRPRDSQETKEIVWRPAAPLRHSILTFAIGCYINKGRTLRPPKDHLGIIAIDGRLVRDLICQCSSISEKLPSLRGGIFIYFAKWYFLQRLLNVIFTKTYTCTHSSFRSDNIQLSISFQNLFPYNWILILKERKYGTHDCVYSTKKWYWLF